MIHLFSHLIICILLFTNSVQSQSLFTFRDLDKAIVELWLSSDKPVGQQLELLEVVQDAWSMTNSRISSLKIEHFDHLGFIEDQDRRIDIIENLLLKNKASSARKEVYLLMTDFRDVRMCFTTDEYYFDKMLDTYDDYLKVHEVIHDEMMGLYEWSEFVWLVDQLKCQIELLDDKFSVDISADSQQRFKDALDRINQCITTLDISLGDAYRPDFEIPCSDLQDALKQLFTVYVSTNNI